MTEQSNKPFDPTTYPELIRRAKDQLTSETWGKYAYFSTKDGKLCMCAHGAMQSVSNPEVVATLACRARRAPKAARAAAEAEPAAAAALAKARLAENTASASAVDAAAVAARAESISEAKGKKPGWVSDEDGSEASYILGLVGLTATFNDDLSTTLEHIHAKFEEAADLAEKLFPKEGVYPKPEPVVEAPKPEPLSPRGTRSGQPKPLVRGTKRWLADIYRRAAKNLETHGWCQGLYSDPASGACCAIGSVHNVCGEKWPGEGFLGLPDVHGIVKELVGARYLYVYNDTPGRTKAEVVRVLRGIAYMLDHGGRLPPWAVRAREAGQ
jgi:hypothetical protein